MLIHLTIPFEKKPKNESPGTVLRYYRLRKSLSTRQLAEDVYVAPTTIVQYEKNSHPIPHDIAVQLADVLEIDVSLLFDDYATFIANPYTEELQRIRNELNLNRREFANLIGVIPSYYYKIESGIRRPSRRIYHQIMKVTKQTNRQTSQSTDESLQ